MKLKIARTLGLWVLWIAITSIGGYLGWFLGFKVGSLSYRIWPLVTYMERFARIGTGPAILGLTVGFAQWIVMRRWVSQAGWWIILSSVGASFGTYCGLILSSIGATLFGHGSFETTGGMALIGFGSGLVIGLTQWLVFRKQVPRAGWWILTCAACGTISWAINGENHMSVVNWWYLEVSDVWVADLVMWTYGLALNNIFFSSPLLGGVILWLLHKQMGLLAESRDDLVMHQIG